MVGSDKEVETHSQNTSGIMIPLQFLCQKARWNDWGCSLFVLRVGLFLLSFVDNLRMFSTTSFGLGILNPALGALLVWDDELPETRRNEAAANLLTLASRRDPLNDTSWSTKGLKLYPIGLPLRIWRQGRGSFLQDIKCV